jgi:hypothetical protein
MTSSWSGRFGVAPLIRKGLRAAVNAPLIVTTTVWLSWR